MDSFGELFAGEKGWFDMVAIVAGGVTLASGIIAALGWARRKISRTRGRVVLRTVDRVPRRKPHGNAVYLRMKIENPAAGGADDDETLVGLRFKVALRNGKDFTQCRVVAVVPAEGTEKEDMIDPLDREKDGEVDFAVPIPSGSRFSFDLKVRVPRDAPGDTLIINLLDVRNAVRRDSFEIPWKPFAKAVEDLENGKQPHSDKDA